jgi:hypothetical protein
MSSIVSGAFTVDASIFDRWLDFTAFQRDINDLCAILQFRTTKVISVDENRLEIAHQRFKAHQAAWLELLLPKGTSKLSHLKSTAILIESLIDLTPISVGESLAQIPPSSHQDGGSTQLEIVSQCSEQDIQKFVDGQSHMIAWLIGYHICEFFEKHRTDRIDPYVSRTTDEFETDLVSGLFSGRVTAQALHLILKALFLRD